MEEYYNIMNKNNQRENIEFEISFSIGTQYTIYDYNGEFWDSVFNVSVSVLSYELI